MNNNTMNFNPDLVQHTGSIRNDREVTLLRDGEFWGRRGAVRRRNLAKLLPFLYLLYLAYLKKRRNTNDNRHKWVQFLNDRAFVLTDATQTAVIAWLLKKVHWKLLI